MSFLERTIAVTFITVKGLSILALLFILSSCIYSDSLQRDKALRLQKGEVDKNLLFCSRYSCLASFTRHGKQHVKQMNLQR